MEQHWIGKDFAFARTTNFDVAFFRDRFVEGRDFFPREGTDAPR